MASRMAYIVRRSFYLALDQLKDPRSVEGANQEAARADSNEWNEVEVIGYPYFIHWVKDTFEQFLTANLQVCTSSHFLVILPAASHSLSFRNARRSALRSSFRRRPSTGATMSTLLPGSIAVLLPETLVY
jgi:hypothetical protein